MFKRARGPRLWKERSGGRWGVGSKRKKENLLLLQDADPFLGNVSPSVGAKLERVSASTCFRVQPTGSWPWGKP